MGKKEEAKDAKRETWGGRLDYIFSALSFSVGLGNLWRFPYLCYSSGGGAFLIPYVVMSIIIGYPVLFMEFAFGQYGRKGIVTIWNCCPLFKGVGLGMFLVSLSVCIYYNMLIGWCFYYIFASFQADVPWRTCGNDWNDDNCTTTEQSIFYRNCTGNNGTFYNATCYYRDNTDSSLFEQIADLANHSDYIPKSPSDQYFNNYVLGKSEGLHDLGFPRWQLVSCLFLAWLVTFVCLSKGIESSGKATYVTALFPYVVLLILFINGLTLDGAADGIIYYLKPDWEKLKTLKVWVLAAIQVFFSMSICWGGQITLASYNKFTNNCHRDAIIVAAGDSLTSIFGGIVIFSYMGYMAKNLAIHIDEVATQGAGLAFIVYPEAVTTLPVAQLWAILFMLMLIMVGTGTQFALVQTVQAAVIDVFPQHFKTKRGPVLLLLGICIFCFITGIPISTRGGIYILTLMDRFAASFGIIFFGIVMMLALCWIYGFRRFFDDVASMLGSKPNYFIVACWLVVSPVITVVIFVFTFVEYERTKAGDYLLPIGYEIGGWLFPIVEILSVPAVMIFLLFRSGKKSQSLKQRLIDLTKPLPDWGHVPEDFEPTEVAIPLKSMNGDTHNGQEYSPAIVP